MDLSFVVLTHRRTEGLLRLCLASLEPGSRPSSSEVLVGYNEAGEEAAAARRALESDFPWARWFSLPGLDRGQARNRLVAEARGTYVHFLDDDAQAPPGFADRLLALYARFPDAPGAGGPNVGAPGAPAFERAVDFLLRSPLGAGPMRCRYVTEGAAGPREGWRFMLTNAGLRRDVFEKLSFPAGCASAEENLLLHGVDRALGRCVFDPALFVWHRRRSTARLFLRQVFVNARGRGEITRREASSLQAAVLVPPAFFFSLAGLALARSREALRLLGAYAFACLFETLRLAVSEADPAAALRLPLLFPAAHGAYAAGFVFGLLVRPAHVQSRIPADLRNVAAR